MVKWENRPLTPETGVQLPVGLPNNQSIENAGNTKTDIDAHRKLKLCRRFVTVNHLVPFFSDSSCSDSLDTEPKKNYTDNDD